MVVIFKEAIGLTVTRVDTIVLSRTTVTANLARDIKQTIA
jgi:hypothetical protein